MADPDQTTLLREAARAAAAQVHVAYPATVVSYEAASQRAVVRIAPAFRRHDPASGEVVTYRPPDIPGVPVAFPGAGDYSIAWPLAAGDSGLVVVVSRSMDEWLASGGTTSEPQDPRRHDLTDAVFIPGLRSFAASEVIPSDGLATGVMVLRAPEIRLGGSSASDYVALAGPTKAEFDALRAEVAAHTHPVPGVTVGAGSTTSAPPVGFNPTAGSVAATKVKAL